MDDAGLGAWLRGAQEEEGRREPKPADGGGPRPAGHPPWDDERQPWWPDDGDHARRGWLRLVLLAAVVPWIVVAVLAVRIVGDRPPPSGHAPSRSSGGSGRGAGEALMPGDLEAHAGADGDAESGSGPPRPNARAQADATAGELGAIACVVVQEWAWRTGRYMETAVPERLAWVGEVAIVVVAGIALEAQQGGWGEPGPGRWAVPLQVVEGEPRRVGEPWTLPPLALPAEDVGAWAPVEDERLRADAQHVLAEAGYAEATVDRVLTAAVFPDVVRVRLSGRAPGETRLRAHDVWLTRSPALQLLGHPSPVNPPVSTRAPSPPPPTPAPFIP